jgi:hypothetical protein
MNAQALALTELPKSELVHRYLAKVHHVRHLATKHKAEAQRIGTHLVQSTTAAVVGFAAGGLELKLRTIPKTKIRTDLALAFLLSGANAFNVFEAGSVIAQSAADALTGHGMGRFGEELLKKHGVVAKP